jgi:hypothetical protein
MNEFRTGHRDLDDIESLIVAARNYVRPSDDLRPQVLELARAEHRERRMQRQLAQMAALVLLMVTAITVYRQPDVSDRARAFLPAMEAVSSHSHLETMESSDRAAWETVDSFTNLRRRQADLLRL